LHVMFEFGMHECRDSLAVDDPKIWVCT
jgi:hypothetical protein